MCGEGSGECGCEWGFGGEVAVEVASEVEVTSGEEVWAL